jgi:hypothetical protein
MGHGDYFQGNSVNKYIATTILAAFLSGCATGDPNSKVATFVINGSDAMELSSTAADFSCGKMHTLFNKELIKCAPSSSDLPFHYALKEDGAITTIRMKDCKHFPKNLKEQTVISTNCQ